MPNHPVVVRRWQVIAAFIAVTLAFVVGLYALHKEQQQQQQGREDRVAQINRDANESCLSRHNLANAILSENAALTLAESTALAQARTLKHVPGLSDAQLRAARENARKLLKNLHLAARLAHAADCGHLPKQILNSP